MYNYGNFVVIMHKKHYFVVIMVTLFAITVECYLFFMLL